MWRLLVLQRFHLRRRGRPHRRFKPISIRDGLKAYADLREGVIRLIVIKGGTEAEERSRAFRRSLYTGEDVEEGAVLTRENVRVVRPGFGLQPKHLDAVLGRRTARAAAAGTPVTWDLLV
jgi:hypothetical protein